MGKITIKQLHIGRQVTSLLCESVVIMLCHVLAYSGTSGKPFFFKYDNAVFNCEQEEESII